VQSVSSPEVSVADPATGHVRLLVSTLDVEQAGDAELVSAVCLQGLANRVAPSVFLTLRRRQCHSSFEENPLSADGAARLGPDVLARYRSGPEFWQRQYADRHGYQFRPVDDQWALLEQLGARVRGVVRFRLANRCELPLAMTLAGLEDAVAVPDESPLCDGFLARLPVLADVRGRFSSRYEATRWALQELMPRCSRRAVFSQNDTNSQRDPDIFSLDLAVAQRLFVFNLDFWQARAPRHFALIQEVLGRIEPGSPMYGWGTSEAAMMVAMGPSGTFLICTGCPNLSFHQRVPARAWPPRARRRFDPAAVRLENRHYVTFMVNEGDTLKWMGSVMGSGRWLESARGRLPINWGISPFINEHFPGLMEYFYETSSAQDVFVSSISGYGYYGLKHSAQARRLAEREAALLPHMDVTVGSVYAVHGMMDATNGVLDPATEDWLVQRGCRGYLFEAAQQNRRWMTRAGQPLVGADWSLFYWKYRIAGEGEEQLRGVAERIQRLARAHGAPSFIPVYGGSPADFERIAAALPPGEFQVVGLDEMVELARLAGPSAPSSPAVPAVAPVRAFHGRLLEAARGGSYGPPVVLDLADCGAGRMRAQLRFGWDDQALRLRVEELAPPDRPCESQGQAGYAAGEFDLADGVGLWFDFNLDGTRERGDFTLWLGFSSAGRSGLACCQLNDRVLTSLQPTVAARTSVGSSGRIIEADVPWAELGRWLEAVHQPSPPLPAAARPGFVFGCQPLLVEGRGGRAFLNGRSNRRENETAAVLADERLHATLPMPDGFDASSLRVRLT
jgi:hypothetical protein